MYRARRALSALDRDTAPIDHVFREACRDICDEVGTTRAGIWFFNAAADAITCECTHDCRTDQFAAGEILRAAEFPAYFEALLRDRAVRASDAVRHPATAGFRDRYFAAHDIRSLLDHVVFAGDRAVAVLCAEQCGEMKAWTDENAAYLSQMAILLGIAIETRRRHYAP